MVAERIGVIQTWAPSLSVDEIATPLINEITWLKASRYVIDSLSGFALALAPTFREDFRESRRAWCPRWRAPVLRGR